jgi:beta-glucanase (GH16 family)
MPTKQTRKRSKAVKSKSPKKVQIKTPWYRRWQLLAFVLIFAVGGVAFLHFSHADSNVSCKSLTSEGNTVKFCTYASAPYNALLSTADYVAATNSTVMTSATVQLELCSPQTLICKSVDPSSTIRLYNASQPRYQRLYTHGVTLLRGALYRTCLTMTTGSGWTLNHSCTPKVTYGNSVTNVPTVYTTAAQTTTTARVSTESSYSTTDCSAAPIKKADGSAWKCTFDEEFNSTSLDKTKWGAITSAASGFSSAPDCYMDSPSNIGLSSGSLNLTTRKEAAPFTCKGATRGNYTSQVTSGDVSTYQKFSQQYGRYEIRAKIPSINTTGLQESFWLWPDKPFEQNPAAAPWPATGEIDIVEMYHAVPDRAIPFVHYNPATADSNITNNYCYIDNTQYHNYVLTWSPNTIRVDVDDYNCILDHTNPASPQTGAQPFNKKFFLNLTAGLGVPDNNNKYTDGVTQLPATTKVDYVRIWQ